MSQEAFPVVAARVAATMAGLFRLQGNAQVADLLSSSKARIDPTGFDNWNGGTTLYTLYLDVPIAQYAKIEPDLTELENSIEGKVRGAIRNTGNDVITAVVISPVLEDAMPDAIPAASAEDDGHLWDEGMLRLFISHVAIHRVAVSALKRDLHVLGVSGFVAHEDIEPSLEWQDEIELGLRSMHAMAALLTPEFHESNWTDQEVGVAVARGVLVIPVRLGQNPYGLIAKNQGLAGNLAEPGVLASRIVEILARRAPTADVMREGFVVALETSSSFANSRKVIGLIESASGFSDAQLARLEASLVANDQVSASNGVPYRLRRFVASQRPTAE